MEAVLWKISPLQSQECFQQRTGQEPYFAFAGGYGIRMSSVRKTLIGGDDFYLERNNIEFNRNGGVVLLGTKENQRNEVTHNVISRNYGELDWDVGGDGADHTDYDDLDKGPNSRFNSAWHFQVFPLVNGPQGQKRVWIWGMDHRASRIEVYGVKFSEPGEQIHGGGHAWFTDVFPNDQNAFLIGPEDLPVSQGDGFTLLSFGRLGNTSEYSYNNWVLNDGDLDGMADDVEVGGIDSSTRLLADTDRDGLPDVIEDHNRNGICEIELKETCASQADTDGDGLSDWAETHGDGRYDPGIDTNPFDPDTDGDGLFDGEEDANGNGIWDGHLYESSPLLTESDGDLINDGQDTCPGIFNPEQDEWLCVASQNP